MVPIKQGNRNGTIYVNGGSAFKPPTMTQGSTYTNSIKVFKKNSGGGQNTYSSSDVTAQRRRIAIGKSATRQGLVSGQPSQYRSNGPIPRKQALARARGGGAVAPPKKGAYQQY
jgi:hypothetical protein